MTRKGNPHHYPKGTVVNGKNAGGQFAPKGFCASLNKVNNGLYEAQSDSEFITQDDSKKFDESCYDYRGNYIKPYSAVRTVKEAEDYALSLGVIPYFDGVDGQLPTH